MYEKLQNISNAKTLCGVKARKFGQISFASWPPPPCSATTELGGSWCINMCLLSLNYGGRIHDSVARLTFWTQHRRAWFACMLAYMRLHAHMLHMAQLTLWTWSRRTHANEHTHTWISLLHITWLNPLKCHELYPTLTSEPQFVGAEQTSFLFL